MQHVLQDIMLILFSVKPGQFFRKHVLSLTSKITSKVLVVQNWSRRLIEYFHDTALIAAIVRAERGRPMIRHVASCPADEL
jgi:hypothetical protein